MVKDRIHDAALARIDRLEETVSNQDACNFRLMAEVVSLKQRVLALETQLKQSSQMVTGLDRTRLKLVADKHSIAADYGKVCQIISNLDANATKMDFCRRCKWREADGVCCMKDICTFEVI